MTTKQASISYPWENALPEAAELKQMAKGVYWLRMPLPFALDHINLWLLEDEIDGKKGWTIVDTGVQRDEVKAIWEQIFAEKLNGLPVLRVVVTHMHPDHVGLAGWLCERWNVPLYISMTDYALACLWSTSANSIERQFGTSGGKAAAQHFARHGISDPEVLKEVEGRSSYYPNLVSPPPMSFNRLMDKTVLDINGVQWQCIVGYGHAPEHIALFSPELNVLISGDMVLPTISTNMSVNNSEPESNPLRLYLDSLLSYTELPADTLVLPSHGKPFQGLHARVQQLQDHHRDRLADTLEACLNANGCSAAELLPVLFKRKLDVHQLTFAMGEAIAHLHALYYEGKLKRKLDESGVYRFYAA